MHMAKGRRRQSESITRQQCERIAAELELGRMNRTKVVAARHGLSQTFLNEIRRGWRPKRPSV